MAKIKNAINIGYHDIVISDFKEKITKARFLPANCPIKIQDDAKFESMGKEISITFSIEGGSNGRLEVTLMKARIFMQGISN